MIRNCDVTAVVCTWNAAQTIEENLVSLVESNVGEIILVDADSEDDTVQIASKYCEKILKDPRVGLAVARNIGIREVKTRYVLNWGADNILPPGALQTMLHTLKDGNYAGVSAMTYVKSPKKNYFSWALNVYKKARYYPGERHVIGTPTLFETSLLKKYPYDPAMSWSDDGDLCDRLGELGHKFSIANCFVYEAGQENLRSILLRWKMYGKSDFETFNKNTANWDLKRKIKSFLYPLNNELVMPLNKIKGLSKVGILAFLLLIVLARYYGWIYFYGTYNKQSR
jgi:glycosyltransferase involved in cell wall biosynthesis